VLALLVTAPLCLQADKTDSLKRLLVDKNRLSHPDKSLIKASIVLSDYYTRISFDTAKYYADLSLVLAKKLGNRTGIAMAYNITGMNYTSVGYYDSALPYLDSARSTFVTIKDTTGMVFVQNNLAVVKMHLGDYAGALSYYQQNLVFAENKLFATLDTAVRKVVIKNIPFLMTDTVGFIRKLPTQLVESFKSTLDEVREADLLLHVVDISHLNFEDHIDSVNKILDEIKSADKPTLMVFNKIDAYTNEVIEEDDLITERNKSHYTLQDWEKTWMHKMNGDCIFISALNKENLDEFKEKVYQEVKKIHITRFPYNDYLYQEYTEES
jgi:GTPase SAR1 family protein